MEPQLGFGLVTSDYSLLFLRSRNTTFLFYALDIKSQFQFFNKNQSMQLYRWPSIIKWDSPIPTAHASPAHPCSPCSKVGSPPWRSWAVPSPSKPCPAAGQGVTGTGDVTGAGSVPGTGDVPGTGAGTESPQLSQFAHYGVTPQKEQHVERQYLSDIIKISLKLFPPILFLKIHM